MEEDSGMPLDDAGHLQMNISPRQQASAVLCLALILSHTDFRKIASKMRRKLNWAAQGMITGQCYVEAPRPPPPHWSD